ncbi:MAG: radical SAM protein, partial [Actinobacteria bacterium]|nr:radical SAM protein [Actinomycetota bacterium]
MSRISGRFKGPLICGFKITNRCNLKCTHCPFIKRDKAVEINFKKAMDTMKKLHHDGVRIIVFEGGEPLLWKDREEQRGIGDLIEEAKKSFFFVCITTNGTLPIDNIDPDIFFISIDGLKKTHDRLRGESFERIISNIERFHSKKKIIVNICISRANFLEIPELVKYLSNKVYGITIQFFYPYPEVENIGLNSIQKKQVLGELIELKKEGYRLLDSYSCFQKMGTNRWKCRDFLVASVEPDGHINHGCYLKNRVDAISCADCGFSAHCEISLAYGLDPGAINAA